MGDPAPASDETDHYELLGVSRHASVEEIILAYRLVVRTILAHPELTDESWNLALAEQAFHTLSHADLRADYDARLAEREGRPRAVLARAAYLAAEGRPLVPVQRPPALAPMLLLPAPADAAAGDATDVAADAAAVPAGPVPPRSMRERRALVRLRREGRVHVRLKDGRATVAPLHDVSPRGLSFVTALVLEPGEEVELHSDALLASAVVRNRRALPDEDGAAASAPRHVVGVEFRRVHFASSRGTFLSKIA